MKKLLSVLVVVVMLFSFVLVVQAARDEDDWDSICSKSPKGLRQYICALRDHVRELTSLLGTAEEELSQLRSASGVTGDWSEPYPSLRHCYNQEHDLFELHMKNEWHPEWSDFAFPGFIAIKQRYLDGSIEWIDLGFFDLNEVKVYLTVDETGDSSSMKFVDGEWEIAGWHKLTVETFIQKDWVCPNNTW